MPAVGGLGVRATVRLMNPVRLFASLWAYRDLVFQLARRDVDSRYRGSYLGALWSFLNPLFMLTIYTFVFSVIFKARWGLQQERRLDFALVLFCGLIVFNTFAECLGRAPSLVVGQPQYVKKVKFPLQILPIVVVLSTLVHTAVSFTVLLLGVWFGQGTMSWTVLWLPLVIVPLLLLCSGCGWFLSALGVFVRDVGHLVGLLVTSLLFLSPIFYPASAVPDWAQPVYAVNPLSIIIKQARRVVIWGQVPEWGPLLGVTAVASLVALAGYAWFQRTRNGFADVL